MVITYKTLPKITFPVFLLPNSNWALHDGLLFLDEKLLDDKNMSGASLGIRRAQTSYPELHRLNRAISSKNGILKQGTNCFIDSKGVPFIYEKTLMSTMKYLKITEVVQKDTASIIRVKGCKTPFTVPRPPDSSMNWAGILHLHGLPWMLYEYSETKLKDTRRKV